MSTELERFEFPETGQTVRTVADAEGDPWFYARDVCDVLEIVQVGAVVNALDADERRDVAPRANAGSNRVGKHKPEWLISESGLYAVILRSRKDQAKRFRKWVTSEVIPSIRRTGSYTAPVVVDQAEVATRPDSDLDVIAAMVGAIRASREESRAALELAQGASDAAEAVGAEVIDMHARLDRLVGAEPARMSCRMWAQVRGLEHMGLGGNAISLGGSAARVAGRMGVAPVKVWHNDLNVHTWPAEVWDVAYREWAARRNGDTG
jgi:prophage antirepressor-like protein